MGRIGLAVAVSSPNIIYAIYADHPGYFMGVYKTTNSGLSWFRVNDSALASIYYSFGWYFGNIRVDPTDPDKVFALGVPLYLSTNGGNSWGEVGATVHVDQHAMVIPESDPSRVYLGNDGGVYLSSNGGWNYTHSLNMPSTQFYAINIDRSNPERLYGGTQDNGTLRTLTGALDDWQRILGGDGFYCAIDYDNPNILYAEYQWGALYKSTNNGGSWNAATSGIGGADRTNWCTPVVMDPNHPNILYYGSNRLYRSTNGATWWAPISPDLTDGPGSGNLTYGTITTIAASPSDSQVVYVGTDDANVWVTRDLGGNWTDISAGLPDRWVTRVAVDSHNSAVAYVTHSGYKIDSYVPHIHRTADYGQTWQDISGNLPQAPITVVVVDPDLDSTLYVGTDVGVYVTTDLGQSWSPLATGLPIPVVHDLVLHQASRSLVAGTHGRSMFRFSLDVHDGGVVSLDAPGDTVFTDSTYAVQATVRNFGNVAETFDVVATINGYTDTVLVVGLPPGADSQLTFSPWTVPPADSVTYTMTVCTYVPGDADSTNDCAQKSVFAYSAALDAGVVSLDAPGDTVFTDSTYAVQATVRNFGNIRETFDVIAIINGYTDTARVIDLTPGADSQLTFSPWTVPPADSVTYTMTVCTDLTGDLDTTNDCAQKPIFAYNPVGVEELPGLQLSVWGFRLSQNHPNPFSRTTTITYSLPESRGAEERRSGGDVSTDQWTNLSVYDLSGRLVQTLVEGRQEPGIHEVEWDGRDQASGIYFYRLLAGDSVDTKRMILLH